MALTEAQRRGDMIFMEAPGGYSVEEKTIVSGAELEVGDVLEDFSGSLNKVTTAANAEAICAEDYPGKVRAAKGRLSFTAAAGNTETVVIGSKTYTFQTILTDVDGNVLAGADADASIDNLIAAITLGAGAGTVYAASMTEHPDVTAYPLSGDAMRVEAKIGGQAGNGIATTTTVTGGSWDAAKLEGGDGVPKTKAVCYVRHCGVDQDKLNYNGQTVATVNTALEAKGIVVRQ